MICIDLDGTLFETDEGIDYADNASIKSHSRPDHDVIDVVDTLFDRGPITIVTGRPRTARPVTIGQLEATALADVDVRLQPKWGGYDAMITWKASVLEELGARVYIGDHSADRRAAYEADVRFIPAEVLHLLARLRAKRGEGGQRVEASSP